jgi:HK97 family phage prohead protease
VKPSRLCYRAVEFRSETSGDGRTLEGHAAVWDSPTLISERGGQFEETILRGAFKKTLQERTPVLQFDHGMDPRTGSVPIGSIEDLHEDDHGLFVRARLFDNAVVEPIRQAIEGRAIDGMSFRFSVTRETWDDKPKISKRAIREVSLYELGPVVFPAYDATSVGVRSILAHLDDDDRKALIAELAAELRIATDLSDAASRTSDTTDAAPEGTSATRDESAIAAALEALRKATT